MGRVPQVRQSVPGPKKTGEAHHSFHFIEQRIQGGAWKSNRKISFSTQVRLGEPGAPVQFLMGSAMTEWRSKKANSLRRGLAVGRTCRQQLPAILHELALGCSRQASTSLVFLGNLL